MRPRKITHCTLRRLELTVKLAGSFPAIGTHVSDVPVPRRDDGWMDGRTLPALPTTLLLARLAADGTHVMGRQAVCGVGWGDAGKSRLFRGGRRARGRRAWGAPCGRGRRRVARAEGGRATMRCRAGNTFMAIPRRLPCCHLLTGWTWHAAVAHLVPDTLPAWARCGRCCRLSAAARAPRPLSCQHARRL